MPRQIPTSSQREGETLSELRKRLGLFSFRRDEAAVESSTQKGQILDLELKAGGLVEWLSAGEGAGRVASAMQLMSQRGLSRGFLAIVDAAGTCYPPALTGWGVHPARTLLIRPTNRNETCWAIEQCLRCSGVTTTWAWLDQKIHTRVYRRWQLAAESGGGVGIFFRPECARSEPAWADVRLLATPLSGGGRDARRIRIDVLYHRGGLGGIAQVWEIDHAEGVVRLVPEMAHPAASERTARA